MLILWEFTERKSMIVTWDVTFDATPCTREQLETKVMETIKTFRKTEGSCKPLKIWVARSVTGKEVCERLVMAGLPAQLKKERL